jgi:hypothetical protein
MIVFDPVISLPEYCELVDALEVVREAVVTHDPQRRWLVIVAGTKLRNVPQYRTKKGKTVERLITHTTAPGDQLYGVPFDEPEVARERRAEYLRHVKLLETLGYSPPTKEPLMDVSNDPVEGEGL